MASPAFSSSGSFLRQTAAARMAAHVRRASLGDMRHGKGPRAVNASIGRRPVGRGAHVRRTARNKRSRRRPCGPSRLQQQNCRGRVRACMHVSARIVALRACTRSERSRISSRSQNSQFGPVRFLASSGPTSNACTSTTSRVNELSINTSRISSSPPAALAWRSKRRPRNTTRLVAAAHCTVGHASNEQLSAQPTNAPGLLM